MNEWLKTLKVGDKVIVESRYKRTITTVEKITAAGNIKANGILFNSNGMERGGGVWNTTYLKQATPEVIEEITNQAIIAKAIKLMRETPKITLEQAKNIINLLNPQKIRSDTNDR